MSFEVEKDWITHAGLRAVYGIVIMGGRRSHRCGYVEIPAGHPLHGVSYNEPCSDIPKEAAELATMGQKSPILALTASVNAGADDMVRCSPDIVFDCHGGLTFSGSREGDDDWWFGFDCAHAGDGAIQAMPGFEVPGFLNDGPVRSSAYVEEQCESLAEQITAMFPPAEAS